MKLHLVIDNTKKEEREFLPTCRNSCELFDQITGECGINNHINPDDPYLAARCADMIYKEQDDESAYFPSSYEKKDNKELLTEEEINDIEASYMFWEFHGEKFDTEDSNYPEKPDFPSKREDAVWFVSPNQRFGCWIINKSRRKFVDVNSQKPEQGWNKNIYKSPFPLHDHKTALSIASRMAWYVDEDGFGQYVLLANGEISMISAPRPNNWKNKE